MTTYELEDLLDTDSGMTHLRYCRKNINSTDHIAGVDWFTFAGNMCSTIYVDHYNWIGLGAYAEHLKVCRRNGTVDCVYRQEGVLSSGVKFLKLWVTGYTQYNSTASSYCVRYEAFLFSDGYIYLYVGYTPKNSSYIGTSAIYDGTNTVSLTIPANVTINNPVEITIDCTGDAPSVAYERYTPSSIESISVTTLPSKTIYFVGAEELDTAGMVVTATYSNGVTTTFDDGYTVSGFDSSAAGTKEITVTLFDLSTTYSITVMDLVTATLTVTNGTGSGTYDSGTEVTVTTSEQDSNGCSFWKWVYSGINEIEELANKNDLVSCVNYQHKTFYALAISDSYTPNAAGNMLVLAIMTYSQITVAPDGWTQVYALQESETNTFPRRIQYAYIYTKEAEEAAEYIYFKTVIKDNAIVCFIELSGATSAFPDQSTLQRNVSLASANVFQCQKTEEKAYLWLGITRVCSSYQWEANGDTANVTIIPSASDEKTARLEAFFDKNLTSQYFTAYHLSSGYYGSLIGVKLDACAEAANSIAFTMPDTDVTFTAVYNTVTSITATNLKSKYITGESLDESATAEMADGTTETLSESDYTVTGYDANTAGEQTVTFTYKGYSQDYTVTVMDVSFLFTLSDSAKTEYLYGESLSTDGITAAIAWSDGTTENVDISNITFSGFDSTTAGEKTITASYRDVLTATYVIAVKTVKTFSVESVPDKTEYIYGESLDITGLTLKAVWTDGTNETEETVTEGYALSGFDSETDGEKTVTITYYNASASFTVNVTVVLVKYIGYPTEENVTLSLDYRTGACTVSGTGATKDYTSSDRPLAESDRLKIKTVIINSGVTSIGVYLFCDCKNLETISIPSTVTSIGDYALANCCDALTTVTIPVSVTSMGRYIFYADYKLSSAVLENGVTGQYMFANCDALSIVTLSDSIKVIREGMFRYCPALASINLPSALTTIGSYAFDGCVALTTINLPDTVTTIWDYVFRGSGLTEIELPDSLTKLGIYTFANCTSLASATVPETCALKSLSSGCFSGCTALQEVYIGSNVTTIASDAFTSVPGTITINARTDSISGSPWGAADTATVVWLITVIDMLIKQYPSKIYYGLGESLDTTGLKVVKIYEDGVEVELASDDYDVSGFDSDSTGRKDCIVEATISVDGVTSEVFTADFYAVVTATGGNAYEEDSADVSITVRWPDGEFEDLTNDDLQQGTVVLKESICGERYFIFGGCESNQITFKTNSAQLLDPDAEIDDTRIEVYIKVGDEDGDGDRIFTGRIKSSTRQSSLLVREIIAYDELYKFRNTNIAYWYQNLVESKSGTYITQKEFRDALFEYLGIEQVATTLEYDLAHVPDNWEDTELNAVSIIKDLCLQNSRFGWMNRDGEFEYLKVPTNGMVSSVTASGKKIFAYDEAMWNFDTYLDCTFTEGRIWYPYGLYTDPYPGVFSAGEPTAQEAYEQNIYYNRNSFFIGDSDWLDEAFQGNEYGVYTVMEPGFPICYGPEMTPDDIHLYLAQGYTLRPVHGNPYILPGDTIEIAVTKTAEDGTVMQWTVHSYVMSRTLKVLGGGGIQDEYSAENNPYNSNNTTAGEKVQKVSSQVFQLKSSAATISYEEFSDGSDSGISSQSDDDETSVKKDKLRCCKRILKTDYEAMVSAGTTRTDTLYFVYEEV